MVFWLAALCDSKWNVVFFWKRISGFVKKISLHKYSLNLHHWDTFLLLILFAFLLWKWASQRLCVIQSGMKFCWKRILVFEKKRSLPKCFLNLQKWSSFVLLFLVCFGNQQLSGFVWFKVESSFLERWFWYLSRKAHYLNIPGIKNEIVFCYIVFFFVLETNISTALFDSKWNEVLLKKILEFEKRISLPKYYLN